MSLPEPFPVAAQPALPPRGRLQWLDFYRGLAVVVMIETHVVNTFLTVAVGSEPWRAPLNYLNGLVAPAFLFIAGFAHGLGLRRKRAVRARVGPRLRRLAGIAAVGYAMHLPIGALRAGDWAEAWRVGSQMDVLVCLAWSIAALVIIERICGRLLHVGVALSGVAVLMAAAPLASWKTGPQPIVAALNQTTGSLFPLLPWAAFVFCGFGASQRAASWRGVLPLVAACAGAVALLGRVELTKVSPAFFFERLAWVLMLVPICAWLSARWSSRIVLFAGRESFVVYLTHLALIEWIASLGRNQCGVALTVALYLAIGATSFATAHRWRAFTVARADRARRAAHRRESSAPAA